MIEILNLSRKQISAFTQWLRTLPERETAFLYQSFEPEPIRIQKLKDLYQRYLEEKSKRI
jgi:hypothetical protein